MNATIGKRYRISSVFNTHLTVGSLILNNGKKYWRIICNDGAIYDANYDFYKVVCEW